MGILESVKEAKEKAAKRKFSQSLDLCITLKSFDLSKAENRMNISAFLPNGRGRETKACIITDITSTEGLSARTISKNDLNKLDKKTIKKLARESDYFLAEAPLMPAIGKIMGPVLGPRGKMPSPFPPKANIKPLMEAGAKNAMIKLFKNAAIQLSVGTEQMKDEDIEENIKSVIASVEKKLPKGRQNMGNIYVKMTMGPPIKVKW